MTSLSTLYEPVADDLALVEDTLSLVAQSDFLPLEAMLNQVLSRGGKRLRPAISLLCKPGREFTRLVSPDVHQVNLFELAKNNLSHRISCAASYSR